MPKSRANWLATGITMVAVADVRINSINRDDEADSNKTSKLFGKKSICANCWPISLDRPEDLNWDRLVCLLMDD